MEIERGREPQHLSSKGKRTETFRIWRSREREREKEREALEASEPVSFVTS